MGGTRYNTAVAAHINAHFQPHVPIQPSQVLTGGGLTAIHEMVALSLGDPGDGILVSRPIYGRFELDFGNTAGLEICYADMNGVDVFAEAVVERYEEAFEKAAQRGVKIKAVLIVNPHNPLGRCYPRAALESIMAFCGKRKIHLISDEVYALSVFDNGDANSVGFTSALSIDPEGLIDANRLHVFYGMSKVFWLTRVTFHAC
jgi:1-aminocyclopropane-1-carboxylate synthase